ncbi:MAG: YfiR family protein [Agarilytica sp.]
MKRNKTLFLKLLVLLPALFCGVLAGGSAAAEKKLSEAGEDHIRAAMVIGILRYTSWETDFGETLNICLVGSNDSFTHLEALQDSRVVPSKVINVSRIANRKTASNSECQVLVVGAQAPMEVRDSDFSQPCLLICDDCSDKKTDASVVLRKVKNRIRFDVDLDKAKTNRVKFRASMLELAAKVEGSNE